jgi:hypothetical protein
MMGPLFLNPQAEAILRLCDGHTPVAELVEVAAEVFRTNREEVETRIHRLLHALCRAGIIEQQGNAGIVEAVRCATSAHYQVGP